MQPQPLNFDKEARKEYARNNDKCPCGAHSAKDGKFSISEEGIGKCHSCNDLFRCNAEGSWIALKEAKVTEQRTVSQQRYMTIDQLNELNNTSLNNFNSFLIDKFNWVCFDKIRELYSLRALQQNSCFIYRDCAGQLLNYKIIKYQLNGKRDRSVPPYFGFSSSDGYSSDSLYGAHLLPDAYKNFNRIGIVESEKTAIVAMLDTNNYSTLFVSIGGKNGFTPKKMQQIITYCKDMEIVFYPDNDYDNKSIEVCTEKAKFLREKGLKTSVDMRCISKDLPSGYDLADLILDNLEK